MRDQEPFPLFKGATRVATIFGVPTVPFVGMLIAVGGVVMLTTLWCWLMIFPAWLVMSLITKSDDRAFRKWGLWITTKCRNRNKRFWGASSYSPRIAKRK